MLRLFPKAFAAAAVLGAGVAYAQVDADVNASKQANPGAGAQIEADADVDSRLPAPPASEADADVSSDIEADAEAAPNRPRGDADLDAEADRNTDRPRTEADADADLDAQTDRPRDRDRADADADADLSGKPALGVTFRNSGDALVISRVYPNSPAARMGLRTGDRIISMNGAKFEETGAFVTAAGEWNLDDDAEIVYFRNGQEHTGTVRFMPWTTVFVEDGDDLRDGESPRRVGRPELDDLDDADEAPGLPRGEIEADDGELELEVEERDTAPREVPNAGDVEEELYDSIDE